MAFDALENAVLHRTANTAILAAIYLQLVLEQSSPFIESLYSVLISGSVLIVGYLVVRSLIEYVQADEITTHDGETAS